MYQSKPLTKSASTTEISNVHSQVSRAQTPGPEERFPHSFKSLFTLADVAAKRRANGSAKKPTIKTDENQFDGGGAGTSAILKRSKSSGDVAVLGERSRAFNTAPDAGKSEKSKGGAKPTKGHRGRAATTSSASPSKIPKVKSPTFLDTTNASPLASLASSEDDTSSISRSSTSNDLPEADALKVDDALFVMLTPRHTPVKKAAKNLTLAAHAPSLPRIASPLSPRTNQPWPPRHLQPRAAPRSSPGTGHTNASLSLTKSHWELRYETWVRCLRTRPRPHSARSTARSASGAEDDSPPRSRFPEPLTNPALFPRAGSLTPKALRPVLDGSVVEEDARPALELDWAMRGWPLDKIQRALFVHDMDVRAWFPIGASASDSVGEYEGVETRDSELDLTRVASGQEDDEREKERALRRWEWDWEIRWKVIEGMAEEHSDRDRTECEYDVFLTESDGQEDRAYAGCEVEEDSNTEQQMMEEADWEWSEDAMEVDAIL